MYIREKINLIIYHYNLLLFLFYLLKKLEDPGLLKEKSNKTVFINYYKIINI